MDQLAEGIVNNANQTKQKAALAIDRVVVLATPVDTGRARSNWQVSNGSPILETRQAYAPGENGSTAGPNSSSAIAQAEGAIARARKGASIYISNNLPYIGRLNDGSSAQAPAGFIEQAVAVGNQIIADARLLKRPRR